MKKNTLQQEAIAKGMREYPIVFRGPDNVEEKVDQIIEEKAIAMVYNGISHAVMMATPLDLVDFALGFSLTENIIEKPSQFKGLDIVESDLGYELQIEIASSAFMQLKQRRRQLSGRSGCGLCGLESLEAVAPVLNKTLSGRLPDYQTVASAVEILQAHQQLQAHCGAVHAAALFTGDGTMLTVREDVGRHNALDKLLGSAAGQEIREQDKANCFIVVSSRASYEMVYKAAQQSISTLIAVSAPTTMAIELAKQVNMNLIGFVRPQRQLIYSQSQ